MSLPKVIAGLEKLASNLYLGGGVSPGRWYVQNLGPGNMLYFFGMKKQANKNVAGVEYSTSRRKATKTSIMPEYMNKWHEIQEEHVPKEAYQKIMDKVNS